MIGAYSEQAHHIAYTTVHGGIMSSPVLDERMLPVLDGAIAGARGPVLIVLHLFGSHENAADRYPAAFSHVGTPYDNSIAYTDHMLAHVQAGLAAHGGPAVMFYVSDHGVRVSECTAGIPAHGDVRAAYAVPFYFWASPAWQAARPRAMQAARDNMHVPFTLAAMPASVLDAAGLGYQGRTWGCPRCQPTLTGHAVSCMGTAPPTRAWITTTAMMTGAAISPVTERGWKGRFSALRGGSCAMHRSGACPGSRPGSCTAGYGGYGLPPPGR
ncbi:sulfatase-like hydrolase/transferase [Komagataeibacter rhaeticus]|nr:sulfatase-like hydrolase/transferase [Komagataeibacter rhaeticus]